MGLSIFSRLFIGYLPLFLLSAGVGAYAILQLNEVRSITHSIIVRDTRLKELDKALTDHLLSETRYERKYVILQDGALFQGFIKARHDFEEALAEARRHASTPETRDLLGRVAALHDDYQRTFREEMGFLEAGRSYPAAKYREDKERLANELIEALRELRATAQKGIVVKLGELEEAGARASRVALMMASASALLGIVLAVVITRSITVPLGAMKRKTREIARGVFTADLVPASPPEIGELSKAINTMCVKLGEVDRMKSDFVALMSHELRTPLASIKEGTNLLLEGAGAADGRQRKLLTIIAEESNRLIRLVNDLLDLSKLEAGMFDYQFTGAELGPLIGRAVAESAPLAEAKGITVEEHRDGLPVCRMDTERMLQVLRNLLGNALKFTPAGGRVSITARHDAGQVEVSVTDTGPGIPPGHLETIFEKFRQASSGRSGPARGTGLGLAIVKHVIEAHGGRVWARNRDEQGSEFTFVLPV